MKVILEAQYACTPMPRGVHYYTIQLIQSLLKRKKNDYELIFFDFNKERNNRQWIDKYFSEYDIPVNECNTVSYRDFTADKDIFKQKSYNDYTGVFGDIFHFTHLVSIPDNFIGNMVVTIHDMIPILYPEYCPSLFNEQFRLCFNRLLKVKPVIITVSESSKRDIIRLSNISEEKIHIIPEAYDIGNCSFKNNPDILIELGINFPYLLYLGAITEHKNIFRIIKSFDLLAKQFSDIQLVIAGEYSAFEIDKIKSSQFFSRIIITGYVSDEQKHILYSNALAFLFPSLYEGFGLPVLEAMARGCPVITSNTSSLPEVAGDAAILIDPYNTEQLTYEMKRLITSESLREELKQKGLERCKKFSWDKTAEMTEEVYEIAYKTQNLHKRELTYICGAGYKNLIEADYKLPQMKYHEQKGLVSIIVPIYNNEIYLRACLDSILAQTFTNWEAILVDDGSTDNTGKIIDEYAGKDSRFIAIHKRNEGTLLARKAGLENSRGEFIANIDHDDKYNPQFLEKMYAKIKETNSDFVWCRCQITNRNNFYTTDYKWNMDASENIVAMLKPAYGISAVTWDKLIKRKIYTNVHFLNMKIIWGEDPIQMLQIAFHSKSAAFVPEILYFHREDGSGSNLNIISYVQVAITTNKIINEILKNFFDGFVPQKVKDILYNTIITDATNSYFSLSKRERQKIKNRAELFSPEFMNSEKKLYFKMRLFLAGKEIEFPFTLLEKWEKNIKEIRFKKLCIRLKRLHKCYEIYIYGIGFYAKKAFNSFEEEKIIVKGFIVSDGLKNADKFKDKAIYEVSQIKFNDKQIVVLALNEENKRQVIPRLKELKVRYFEF